MKSKLTQLAEQKSALELKTLSTDSNAWLKAKVAELKRPDLIPSQINREKFRSQGYFTLGGLYFFFYNPKGKDTLPYYDTFPLVLILDRRPDSFLGLNLHYLPVKYRMIFLQKLMPYALLDSNDDIRRVRITYDILSSVRMLKEFKPCLKMYLKSNIKSKLLKVQPNEWDIATYLPVQRFQKQKPMTVWAESVHDIRNS